MVLACVVIHVLACVLPHVLAHVLLHVLARVIIHVHDYYSKTCVRAGGLEVGAQRAPRLLVHYKSGAYIFMIIKIFPLCQQFCTFLPFDYTLTIIDYIGLYPPHSALYYYKV